MLSGSMCCRFAAAVRGRLGVTGLLAFAAMLSLTAVPDGGAAAQGIDWTGESLRFADPTQNFAPLRADDVMPRFKAIKPRDFDPLYQPAGPIDLGQWGFGLEPDETGGGFCVNRGNEMLYVPPGDGQKVFYQRIREWERRTQLDGHVEIWRFDDFRQTTRYDIRYPDGRRVIGENPYPGNFEAARWEKVFPAPF